jgi:hypothetical protein
MPYPVESSKDGTIVVTLPTGQRVGFDRSHRQEAEAFANQKNLVEKIRWRNASSQDKESARRLCKVLDDYGQTKYHTTYVARIQAWVKNNPAA